MDEYRFYYDESEHDRKINRNTVLKTQGYYDSFVTAIVGWNQCKQKQIEARYSNLEKNFNSNAKELKSTSIMRQSQYGFKSLNKKQKEFLKDFFDLLIDEEIIIQICMVSKLEFLINQMFFSYSLDGNIKYTSLKYTLVKSLVQYKPQGVLDAIEQSNIEMLLTELTKFYTNRIFENNSGYKLKKYENAAFRQIVLIIKKIASVESNVWQYRSSFDFLKFLIDEEKIGKYELIIDREGGGSTIDAAIKSELSNVREADSREEIGIRYADMLAGVITKMMKAIHKNLSYSEEHGINKKTLDNRWFDLTSEDLELYKKFNNILMKINNNKQCLMSVYSDDFIVLLVLTEHISQYDSPSKLKEASNAEQVNTKCVIEMDKIFKAME